MRASLFLLLIAFPAGAFGQQLGTLFHTPAERQALERLRRGEPAEQVALPRPDPVITGYIKRSDGLSTVFVDGKPYPAPGRQVQELLEPGVVDRPEVPASSGPGSLREPVRQPPASRGTRKNPRGQGS